MGGGSASTAGSSIIVFAGAGLALDGPDRSRSARAFCRSVAARFASFSRRFDSRSSRIASSLLCGMPQPISRRPSDFMISNNAEPAHSIHDGKGGAGRWGSAGRSLEICARFGFARVDVFEFLAALCPASSHRGLAGALGDPAACCRITSERLLQFGTVDLVQTFVRAGGHGGIADQCPVRRFACKCENDPRLRVPGIRPDSACSGGRCDARSHRTRSDLRRWRRLTAAWLRAGRPRLGREAFDSARRPRPAAPGLGLLGRMVSGHSLRRRRRHRAQLHRCRHHR